MRYLLLKIWRWWRCCLCEIQFLLFLLHWRKDQRRKLRSRLVSTQLMRASRLFSLITVVRHRCKLSESCVCTYRSWFACGCGCASCDTFPRTCSNVPSLRLSTNRTQAGTASFVRHQNKLVKNSCVLKRNVLWIWTYYDNISLFNVAR